MLFRAWRYPWHMMNTTAATETVNDLSVAKTILEQLGGNRFIAMTGAHNFAGGSDSLQFRLPSNFAKNSINSVSITLTPMDTYTVILSRVRGTKVTQISRHEHAYAEDLQKLFRAETGLEVHL